MHHILIHICVHVRAAAVETFKMSSATTPHFIISSMLMIGIGTITSLCLLLSEMLDMMNAGSTQNDFLMSSITYFLKKSLLTRCAALLWAFCSPAQLLSTVYIFYDIHHWWRSADNNHSITHTLQNLPPLILCLFVSPSLSGASQLVSLCRLLRARCYLHGATVQSHLK